MQISGDGHAELWIALLTLAGAALAHILHWEHRMTKVETTGKAVADDVKEIKRDIKALLGRRRDVRDP